MPVTLIEKQTVLLEYGFKGTLAIVDHPVLGRLLLTDGYGGENTPRGGAVRWEHGRVAQLQPGDTLESLRADNWNRITRLLNAVINGYDDTRPLKNWNGLAIEQIAQQAGL